MNKVSILLSYAALGATLAAQNDVITLRDGTTLRNVKVTAWDAKDIQFRTASGNDTRASHLVQDAMIAAVKVAASRAAGDPVALLGEAEANKSDAMVASSLYYKAAMGYYDSGDASSMISALETMEKTYPESPFAPETYRWKIKYFLGKEKPDYKSAEVTAQKYGDASRTRSWSEAYRMDAEYWKHRVDGASGKMQAGPFISAMRDIIARAGLVAPFVAHAAMADLADAYRSQKKYKEALAEYQKLQDVKGLGDDERARMYLGLGYLSLEDAIASQKKDDYHDAFLNFLKVYVNAQDAAPELVAEGLYNAAKSCEQWNGLPTCPAMAGRLRGRLKLRKPYSSTSWAQKR